MILVFLTVLKPFIEVQKSLRCFGRGEGGYSVTDVQCSIGRSNLNKNFVCVLCEITLTS